MVDGAGGMVQVIECLTGKWKAPSSSSNTTKILKNKNGGWDALGRKIYHYK
jgi:hypothetical protein